MILSRGSAPIAESMSAKRAKSTEERLRDRLRALAVGSSSTHDVHGSSEVRLV
jgi:hypothetical protein